MHTWYWKRTMVWPARRIGTLIISVAYQLSYRRGARKWLFLLVKLNFLWGFCRQLYWLQMCFPYRFICINYVGKALICVACQGMFLLLVSVYHNELARNIRYRNYLW